MKILFISSCKPEYEGSVSRLLYDILMACPSSLQIDLAIDRVETLNIDIPDNISFVQWSNINICLADKNNNFAGPFVKKEWKHYATEHINCKGYDCVITYPFQMSALDFVNFYGKIYTIAVDSATMVFSRALLNHDSIVYRIASYIRLCGIRKIDNYIARISKKIYTVGKSDAEAYNVFYNADATFIPHPVIDKAFKQAKKPSWNGSDKLNICFTGSLSGFYVGNLLRNICKEISAEDLSNKVNIYFLGKNIDNKAISYLNKAGYSVKCIDFVESYEAFLTEMHIMLVPLIVGAGTKNRVITAIGVGLDVIGTSVAMENIYGVDERNIANTPDEFILQIKRRLNNKEIYSLNNNDMDKFKKYHSYKQWKDNFWNTILE